MTTHQRCTFCGTTGGLTDVVLDLGPQPTAHQFPRADDPLPDAAHPLAMWCCPGCGLAQLLADAEPVPEIVGAEPAALVAEATRLVAETARRGHLPPAGTVREFGSPHGGSWLADCAAQGLDPVRAGTASVVVDSLGLMHEPDQAAAIRARAEAIAPDGVGLLFFHSLAAIVAEQQWNDLRHGHYAYYSIAVLQRMLDSVGLDVVDAIRSPLYGLSVLLVVRHRTANPQPLTGEPAQLLAEESQLRLDDPQTLRSALGDAVAASVARLTEHLREARQGGRRVYGYAAASRAIAVLALAGVDQDLLPAIADASEAKQGRVTPVSRIPVISPQELRAAQPDEVLVLLPELIPEILADNPALGGRLLAYHPGAEHIEAPDRRIIDFSRSVRWQDKLHDLVPGGAHTYARGADQYPEQMAPVLVRGHGALAWDVDNNCYVEYGIGLRAVTLGHADPRVDNRVRRLISDGINFSRPTRLEAEVAERFIDPIPGAEMVKFAKNGSDVTTAAIRLARAYTGRDMVAICDQSFFSVDDWFIAHTDMHAGIPEHQRMLGVQFQFNDLQALQRVFAEHPDRIAAVILQPATPTEEPAPGYLAAVRELCDSHGAVLVFDEIVTGFRWHRGGVQTLAGVTPDLACWAKGIGNGYPIAALTGRAELMELGGLRTDARRAFTVSTTYGPETVGLAALSAVLEVYDTSDPIAELTAAGRRLADGINQIVSSAGLNVHLGASGHPGCLIYYTHDTEGVPSQAMRTVLMTELLHHGVLGQSLVTCAAHGPDLVDHTVAAFEAAIPAYERALRDGPDTVLTGAPVAPSLRGYAAPRQLHRRRMIT